MHNNLDQIRKPKDVKVSAFVARYKFCSNCTSNRLESHQSIILLTSWSSRVFYAMPPAWQDQFNMTNLQIDPKSLNNLMNYFVKLEASQRSRASRAEKKGDTHLAQKSRTNVQLSKGKPFASQHDRHRDYSHRHDD